MNTFKVQQMIKPGLRHAALDFTSAESLSGTTDGISNERLFCYILTDVCSGMDNTKTPNTIVGGSTVTGRSNTNISSYVGWVTRPNNGLLLHPNASCF